MTAAPTEATIEGGRAGAKALPRNEECEQAILGALFLDNEQTHRVSHKLRPEHFFHQIHGRIYAAIVELVEHGQVATPVTLQSYFDNDEGLVDIGGAEYLSRLVGSAVGIAGAADYAGTIVDLYTRRQLVALGQDIAAEAQDFRVDTPASEQIEEAQRALDGLGDDQGAGYAASMTEAVTGVLSAAEAAYQAGGNVGLLTGLKALDDKLGGLEAGALVVLAGRPGMGKSALAVCIADHVARIQGKRLHWFSPEMTKEQTARRFVSRRSGVPVEKIRRGDLDKLVEWPAVTKASGELRKLPLFIDESNGLTVQAMHNRCRRAKRSGGLDLVVIDQLGYIRPSPEAEKLHSKVYAISDITKAAKAMAKSLEVPVLLLHQLSRAIESRDNKRPTLADLRDSGSIEEDADVVMFVYRAEYYLSRNQPDPSDDAKMDKWRNQTADAAGKALVIIAKHRDGPTGNAGLTFEATTASFGDVGYGGETR